MSKLAVGLVVGFYVAFAAFSVRVKQNVAQAEAYDSFRSGLPVGSSPPDFELAGLDGELVTLEQQIDDGELVLINFWATWCGPCRLEVPMLTDLDERYRVEALPTTVLVDREGDVIDVIEGLDPYLGYRIEMHLKTDDSGADEL